jgi:hypothetical protein
MRQIIALVLLLVFGAANAAPCLSEGPASAGSEADLAVAATSMAVSEAGNRRLITTLGTITNPSVSCFDEIVLELTYFDKGGRLVDTTTQELRGVIALPKTDVNYRVVESVTKASDQYATQKVRLINAEKRYSRNIPKKAEPSFVESLFVSWTPMIVLILVWIVIMRKYIGRRSPQYQTVSILERQLAVSEAHLKAFERVAAALESHRSGPGSA